MAPRARRWPLGLVVLALLLVPASSAPESPPPFGIRFSPGPWMTPPPPPLPRIKQPRWLAPPPDGTLFLPARRLTRDTDPEPDDESAEPEVILQLTPTGQLRVFADGFKPLQGPVAAPTV